MCVVSMIGDHYADKFRPFIRPVDPWITPLEPWEVEPRKPRTPISIKPPVSREEFDQLKREVAEMKELLRRAKDYDERNNEPDCEVDEKMEILRKVAEAVGINLDDVLTRGEAE